MNPSTTNFISSDVEIIGTVTCSTRLVSDAKIQGDIVSSDVLVIGAQGTVQGNINASAVSIYGKVKGNVTVKERCELKANAELLGDLKAPRLHFEEGATLIGYSEVTPGKNFSETARPALGGAAPGVAPQTPQTPQGGGLVKPILPVR
jgi:cytoskeletal protein CcmA (bactofilin family)